VTLHLVRIPVDPRGLSAFAVAHGLSDDDGGYALHCALRTRFGVAAPQPFRFLPEHRRGPHLLGYAGDNAALADAAALPVADPLLNGVFAGPPEVQPMPAGWREGARYRFEVRVRPVVRFGGRVRAARAERPGAWQNRAGEVDAFVAACERAGAVEDGGAPVTREAVYLDWLARRLEGAAVLEAAEHSLLRRSRARRSVHGKGGGPAPEGKPRTRLAEGPDVVMAGTLAVADLSAFAGLLARGVGRHAAFGYGMLLLSAPGRAG